MSVTSPVSPPARPFTNLQEVQTHACGVRPFRMALECYNCFRFGSMNRGDGDTIVKALPRRKGGCSVGSVENTGLIALA